jgi:SAM-dependent methyltransferase
MADRQENLFRLSEIKLSKKDSSYLVYKSLFRDLLIAIDKHAKGKLLDIGCGNKPYQSLMTNITEYIGCDIIQSSNNCVDIISQATNIPVDNKSFDTVFSTQTIEHVEDHLAMCKEAYRTLKNGGYFIVSGPMYWPHHEEPYDFFRFTKYGLKSILEKAGFEIVDIKANGGSWATAGQSLIHAIENHVPKTIVGKLFRKLFYKLNIIVLINWSFDTLDTKNYNETNTINFVCVAKKV